MFPCTICGECCRQIKLAEETKWLDRGDGICQYFNEHLNQCNIYDERPRICKIDEMFDAYYHEVMTREKFYQLNAKCCNILQENAGIDKEYRIYLSHNYPD
jgi:uncharacterized protein